MSEAVNRRRSRLLRTRVVPVKQAPHGTRSRYVGRAANNGRQRIDGCRCDPCTDAEALYSREYKRRRRAQA